MQLERVVIVNDFGHVNGGTAQVAIASAIALRAAGLDVDYFYAVGPADPRLADAGVTTVCTDQLDILSNPNRRQAAIEGLWNTDAAARLHSHLLGCARLSTVVHIHGWTKALSASVFAAARKLGFPAVVTLHDYFAACPNGGFYDYRKQAICTRRALGAKCLASNCDARSQAQKLWRIARHLVAAQKARLPQGIEHVIYLSALSKNVLEPYFDCKTQWHYVTNPVQVAQRERVEAHRNRELVFIGRLSPEKGADLFAQAATAEGMPARIIGDGTMRAEVAARWPAIEISGWMEPPQVILALRNARALVFPSRWYETFGLTVHEALACGVPVVVADCTAASDAVTPGFNGFHFRQGDAESLRQAMIKLADDRLVAQMSENAYAKYWQ